MKAERIGIETRRLLSLKGFVVEREAMAMKTQEMSEKRKKREKIINKIT